MIEFEVRMMMMMDWVVKLLVFVLLAFAALIHAQDQSGFISIDCGIPENSNYTDVTTGINYVSDTDYTDAGMSNSISSLYMTNGLEQQLRNVRSFPEGIKNCYTITPPQIQEKTRYFVRASFMYGNYDSKNLLPTFDIYLGVDYWDTVYLTDSMTTVSKEILYNPSSNYTYVCLVNTGAGTPFISVLEIRLVNDDIYTSPNNSSLELFGHWDLRSYANKNKIRYEDDIFDRVWKPSFFQYSTMELNTTLSIESNIYLLPSKVMSNAVAMQNATESIDFYWQPQDPNSKYFIYMHFADFQNTQLRKFNINLNGDLWYGPLVPAYLSTTTIYTINSSSGTWFNFSLAQTLDSKLPPMINALEIYIQKDFASSLTSQQDVDVMKIIKFTYGVVKNWQGDPCTPGTFSWLGVKCFNDTSGIPRISSLDMSSSGLNGTISPSMVNLSMLQSLDLSNNSLTGEVPKYFSQMQKLTVLNLSGNNLTEIVPSELLKRSADGLLALRFDGNPHLCASESCETKNGTTPPPAPPPPPATVQPTTQTKDATKKNDYLIPIIAAVASVTGLVFLLCFVVIIILIKKIKAPQPQG